MSNAKTAWYSYRQNNSGGVWDGPAIVIVVQADSEESALRRAKEYGLDVDASYCPCCGERWSEYSTKHGSKPPLGGNDGLFLWSDSDTYVGRGVPRVAYLHANGDVEVVQ